MKNKFKITKSSIKGKRVQKYKNIKNKINFNYVIVILIIILLSLFLYNIFIIINKPIYSKEFNVNFVIGDKLGLTINSTSIDYGIMLAGTSSTKTINITNEYNFPIKVKVLISPEIKGYLFSQNNFISQPHETVQHSFLLILSPDAKRGDYSGKLRLNFFKVK